jgi:succinate dehydrogenase / fumarate reductase membrane anchor subunit
MNSPARNGSAHAGLFEWLLQRLTAIYLGIFLVALLVRVWLHPVAQYDDWRVLFAGPWQRVAWLFGILSMLIHGWVGIRSVLLDYLSTFPLRLFATGVTATGLIVCALWALAILFGGSA